MISSITVFNYNSSDDKDLDKYYKQISSEEINQLYNKLKKANKKLSNSTNKLKEKIKELEKANAELDKTNAELDKSNTNLFINFSRK